LSKGGKERFLVTGGLLTKHPGYSRNFLRVLQSLVSHNGIYIPQQVEIGSDTQEITQPFDVNSLEKLSLEWEKTGPFAACVLKRSSPVHVDVTIGKSPLLFHPLIVHVECSFVKESARELEFLSVMKDLYDVVHSAFGSIETPQMVRRSDSRGGKLTLGIDLERALPDIYWANFFGPEYVRMFSIEKLESAPVHRIEKLSDGGVLLVLTRSLSDYDADPEGFNRARMAVKEHLGIEAFDNGDWHFRGKAPQFYTPEERRRILWSTTGVNTTSSDSLSTVGRAEWQEWIEENPSLAAGFVQEFQPKGLKLGYTYESLKRIDDYLNESSMARDSRNMDFLKKLAAYVSQTVIRQSGGSFSFDKSEDLPTIRIGSTQLSPLARTQKVILEGEKFELWVRVFTKELIPQTRSSEQR